VALVPADALRVAALRPGPVLRIFEGAGHRPLQLPQLRVERGMALRGKGNGQVHEQGAQAARDLDAAGPEVPDLRERQLDEVLPVGRPVDEPQAAVPVTKDLSTASCKRGALTDTTVTQISARPALGLDTRSGKAPIGHHRITEMRNLSCS